MSFVGGRQPADPRKPKLKLRGAAIAPDQVDWLSEVSSWPMLGNDQIGDCTAAAAGHTAQQINWYGRMQNAPVSEAEAIAMYSAISGYDPRTGRGDVGATLQDALAYWHKTGIGGNQIAAYAWIDPTDLDLVRTCIAVFGSVYCGMWFPQSAMDQIDRGQPWTVVNRSPNIGGHCVPISAYDPSAFYCTTWGQVQEMSTSFFTRYFDEVVVPIDLDWVNASGVSPDGLDIATLNADYTALTGEPGPFPEVAPPPPPDDPPIGRDAALVAAKASFDAAFEAWSSR